MMLFAVMLRETCSPLVFKAPVLEIVLPVIPAVWVARRMRKRSPSSSHLLRLWRWPRPKKRRPALRTAFRRRFQLRP